MQRLKLFIFPLVIIILFACGSLEKKSILIDFGNNKERVLEVMGTPDDRQFQGKNEVWHTAKLAQGLVITITG